MTDHLEPYRQLARAIRFAPPQGQHERFNRLVHQPLPVPSVPNVNTAQVAQSSFVTPDPGPSPDPSEHAAALVRAAVSKHTVLPPTYNIQENIGDRISRLANHKITAPLIIAPKIPEPDPNWTPPPPPVTQNLVTQAPTLTEVSVENKSAVPHPETPVNLSEVPTTTFVPTEDVSPPETQSIDLSQIETIVIETEDVSPPETQSIDLSQIETIVVETEDVSPPETQSIDLSQIETIVVEAEDLVLPETQPVESNQTDTTVVETDDESAPETQSVDLSQIETIVVEAEDLVLPETQPVESNQTDTTVVETDDVSAPETQSVESNQIETTVVKTEDLVAPETQPVESNQTDTTVVETDDVSASETQQADLSLATAPVENEAAITAAVTAAAEIQDAVPVVEKEDLAGQEEQGEEQGEELNQTATNDGSELAVSEVKTLPKSESEASESNNLTVTCPKCDSTDVRKNGRQKDKQKYLCKNCGRQFVWTASVEEKVQPKSETEEPKPVDEIFTPKSKGSKSKLKKPSKGFGRGKKR
ncbi:IS1 family transposase [Aerosakkonema sp. BLCC-F183]|uniref:IS1/IS1595 family N-terminal zinc-binding domain-containing protein n=1 Tax=Aerosakkonema sp. BLCC-F183 TaxID=3342834 RepID=UPI0035BAF445